MAKKDREAERLRRAIIGGLNLLSAMDWDTIMANLPATGTPVDRMCQRLRDHLRVAIGLAPVEEGTPNDYADAAADRWLRVTDHVQDQWLHPVSRVKGVKRRPVPPTRH